MSVSVPIVMSGQSIRLPGATIGTGVYNHLVVAICGHYPGLPDYRTMWLSEIRMFYEAIRLSLERITAPGN